jgi:hypothetical protein
MGQRYWSVAAWRAEGGGSFPKRARCGDLGVLSEHEVPKNELKRHILADRANVRAWLQRNLGCVVTVIIASRKFPEPFVSSHR